MFDSVHTVGTSLLGGAWPVAWSLIKIVALVVPLMLCVAYLTLWERKAIGWTQIRPGPNRVGPLGLGQRRQQQNEDEQGGLHGFSWGV